MTEGVPPYEHELLKRASTRARTEALLGTIEDGGELESKDIAPVQAIESTFDYLKEVHDTLVARGESSSPQELAGMLRGVNSKSKELGGTARAYHMASATAQLAYMKAPPQEKGLSDYAPPVDSSIARRMPPAYYNLVDALASAAHATAEMTPSFYDRSVKKTVRAVTSVSDAMSYSGHIQRELLRCIDDSDLEKEVIFDAWTSVSSKVLLKSAKTLDGTRWQAEQALEALYLPWEEEETTTPRLAQFIEGTHGVMSAALTLRSKVPDVTAAQCMAFLYANASNLGEMARRFNKAAPVYKNRTTADDDHDAGLLLDDIKNGLYGMVWNGEDEFPELVVAEVLWDTDEFADYIFSEDPEKRAVQERAVRKRRMVSGGCPARYKLRLPDGRIKNEILQFDNKIKELYQVDPRIITAEGFLDPAALLIARTIEMGVSLEECNLWTHGFEEFNIPVAEGNSQ